MPTGFLPTFFALLEEKHSTIVEVTPWGMQCVFLRVCACDDVLVCVRVHVPVCVCYYVCVCVFVYLCV